MILSKVLILLFQLFQLPLGCNLQESYYLCLCVTEGWKYARKSYQHFQQAIITSKKIFFNYKKQK